MAIPDSVQSTRTAATEDAAKTLDLWVERKGAAPKKGCASPRTMKKHATELQAMMQARDWSKAKACHLVALYMWCHERVYGVPASELSNGYEYIKAAGQASRLVTKEFSDNITAAITFIQWTWKRENWREKKRREEGDHSRGFRIGWSYQFSARLVTDYRIDSARRSGV